MAYSAYSLTLHLRLSVLHSKQQLRVSIFLEIISLHKSLELFLFLLWLFGHKELLVLGYLDEPDFGNGGIRCRSQKTEANRKFGIGDSQPGNFSFL